MARNIQRSICCPCGNEKVLALGLCATCYTLKRQDEEYFGGYRENVLARDGYRCAVPGCTTLKRGKRSIAVHHRQPGDSEPKLMITLCLACHAKVTRTQFLCREWPPLLRTLWREQHPGGHEQRTLNFSAEAPPETTAQLFEGTNYRQAVPALQGVTSSSVPPVGQQRSQIKGCDIEEAARR